MTKRRSKVGKKGKCGKGHSANGKGHFANGKRHSAKVKLGPVIYLGLMVVVMVGAGLAVYFGN